MISDRPYYAYTLMHHEYFENIDNYMPTPEYRDVVLPILGEGWSVSATGFWTSCTPEGFEFLQHGWKIHLSAVPAHAEETLQILAPLMVTYGVAFKFVADLTMLKTSLSKNWGRTGAGKFVTIYPRSVDEFKTLCAELAAATAHLQGPYILSDRPYGKSRVVFYRYGEHVPVRRIEASGQLVPVIEGPNGETHSDERKAYFTLPSWVQDPFTDQKPLEPPKDGGVLLNGRYRVQRALRYGAMGGIYTGLDTQTGATVVLREARPLLGSQIEEADSFALLRKEARILQKLGPTGLAPQFVDLFQEWEHLFLVQELLDADSLWGHAINFFYRSPDLTPLDAYEPLRETIRHLIHGLQAIHGKGIILRDLTRSNVMVTSAGGLKFIDFEFAYEVDEADPFLFVQTPGFASPEQLRNNVPTFATDHYALGALILDLVTFYAIGLDLNRASILAAFDLHLRDLRLPPALRTLVEGLTNPAEEGRWDLERALVWLEGIEPPAPTGRLFTQSDRVPDWGPPPAGQTEQIAETVDGIAAFLADKARYGRTDSLWPSSAQVFFTNPVSLSFGAVGPAYFLLRNQGRLEDRVLDWIFARATTTPVPAGLFLGLGGVAVLLLEVGRTEQAREVLALAERPVLKSGEPGLYAGEAGRGVTHLHFHWRTGDPASLQRAREIGDELLNQAVRVPAGLAWGDPAASPLGLAEGPAGVALFLTYLGAATGDGRYLEGALDALRFELSHRQELGRQLLWFPRTDSGVSDPKSPHTYYGTAGFGTACLRAALLSGSEEWLGWAERAAATVAERFTNKLWQDFGLAGYGELLLDWYWFTGEERYLRAAHYLTEPLLLHRVPRSPGFTYLGEDHLRVCSDHSMGASGIGLFLDRLLHPERPRLALLDEMLRERLAKSGPLALEHALALEA